MHGTNVHDKHVWLKGARRLGTAQRRATAVNGSQGRLKCLTQRRVATVHGSKARNDYAWLKGARRLRHVLKTRNGDACLKARNSFQTLIAQRREA